MAQYFQMLNNDEGTNNCELQQYYQSGEAVETTPTSSSVQYVLEAQPQQVTSYAPASTVQIMFTDAESNIHFADANNPALIYDNNAYTLQGLTVPQELVYMTSSAPVTTCVPSTVTTSNSPLLFSQHLPTVLTSSAQLNNQIMPSSNMDMQPTSNSPPVMASVEHPIQSPSIGDRVLELNSVEQPQQQRAPPQRRHRNGTERGRTQRPRAPRRNLSSQQPTMIIGEEGGGGGCTSGGFELVHDQYPPTSESHSSCAEGSSTTPGHIRTEHLIRQPQRRRKRSTSLSDMPALPSFVQLDHIKRIMENTPMNREFDESIRMLVLLEDGEQRLITFTLPKETCSIHEILEQVNVPFNKDTPIKVLETNVLGIDYVVTVGDMDRVPAILGSVPTQPSTSVTRNLSQPSTSTTPDTESLTSSAHPTTSPSTPTTSSSTDLLGLDEAHRTVTPKFIKGKLAVCPYCGYISEDFNRCSRCKRHLPDNVKAIVATNTNGGKPKKNNASDQQNSAPNCSHNNPRQTTEAAKANSPPKPNTASDNSAHRQLHIIPHSSLTQPPPLAALTSSTPISGICSMDTSRLGITVSPVSFTATNKATGLGTPKLNLLAPRTHLKIKMAQQEMQMKAAAMAAGLGMKAPVHRSSDLETVVVSSDDEEDNNNSSIANNSTRTLCGPSSVAGGLDDTLQHTKSDENSELRKSDENSIRESTTTFSARKEPTIQEIKAKQEKHSEKQNLSVTSSAKPTGVDGAHSCSTLLVCRTVRIGSYRFVPSSAVCVDAKGIHMKVPLPKSESTLKLIDIDTSSMIRILMSTQKALSLVIVHILPSAAVNIRKALGMAPNTEYYFDPLSELNESQRRIIFITDFISEDNQNCFYRLFDEDIFMELTYKEANDILSKSAPKDLFSTSVSDLKPLLIYPPQGRGRITINTDDYICLGHEQFLNDVIIDFYLTYLFNNLSVELQTKVHMFSTFFYKRLTTKPSKVTKKIQPNETDPNLSPAEKRWARVKTWTKNVNIFDKDFIVVPINEHAHWFLAIICFPNMVGCHTFDGKPIQVQEKAIKKSSEQLISEGVSPRSVPCPKSKKKPIYYGAADMASSGPTGSSGLSLIAQGCSTRSKVPPSSVIEDLELSDKDEAEGNDSELESESDDDSTADEVAPKEAPKANNGGQPPIKQPCILIFDSLAGASRSRVVATLRDYLTCEYSAKKHSTRTFTKDTIRGACPKVPQQNNFTDCGLYLLQYVEQFFADPITDYHIPIKQLRCWFDESIATRKREEIAILIQTLMKQYGRDLNMLPELTFPSLEEEEEDEDDEEEDEEMDDEDDDIPDVEDEEETRLSTRVVSMDHDGLCAVSDGNNQNINDDISQEAKKRKRSHVSEKRRVGMRLDEENTSDEQLNICTSTLEAQHSEDGLNPKNDLNATLTHQSTPLDGQLPPKVATDKDTLNYLKSKRIIRHNKMLVTSNSSVASSIITGESSQTSISNDNNGRS